jgi:phage terminase large subunit-like protein
VPAATPETAVHVAAAEDYARAVISGDIPACRWVRLACERQLRDLERFAAEDSPFYFDCEQAERVCNIVEHFPHVKGIWATHHKRLVLEGWQAFILCTVFGWLARADAMRRFRVAYSEIPRKNAKSTMTSAVGNYLLACDHEEGALVVSAANTRDQARLVFTDAQQMARREPGFRARFGVEVLANAIVQPETASRFEAISAEYSNLDGLNVHGALVDELHAHPTRGLWDILETATGSRAQPLIWAITTAGLNRASICYDQRRHVTQILEGQMEDDSYFGIIYTIDEGDDPYEETSWIKANPNYGVSIYPEMLRSVSKRAQVMPSAQAAFLTKHLNIWVNADHRWLPGGAWDKLADAELSIDEFEGQTCFVGVDLAVVNDIAAVVAVFPPAPPRTKWVIFGRYYLPADVVELAQNSHYQGWERVGLIIGTPGAVTDVDFIIEDLMDWAERFDVREIAFDPYKTIHVKNQLQKRGLTLPLLDIRQSIAIMSPAMKQLEMMVLNADLAHDGNPVLAWMMSNVVAHRDEKDNIMPRKDADEKKIDGVLALLMALDRGLRAAASEIDWENRPGLWSI